MAARVTVQEVRDVLPAGVTLSDAQIELSIGLATCAVDALALSSCGDTLSDDCLKNIELFLSLHSAAAFDAGLAALTSEKDPCCGGSASYGFTSGTGLLSTRWGQMANTASGGCLAECDKQPAQLFSIGSH